MGISWFSELMRGGQKPKGREEPALIFLKLHAEGQGREARTITLQPPFLKNKGWRETVCVWELMKS